MYETKDLNPEFKRKTYNLVNNRSNLITTKEKGERFEQTFYKRKYINGQ